MPPTHGAKGAPPPPPPPPKPKKAAPGAPPPPPPPAKPAGQKRPPGGSVGSLAEQVAAKASKKSGGQAASEGTPADDGRLVRVRLDASPVAEEEGSFAAVCSQFLAKAQQRHSDLTARGKAAQAALSQLAMFLGEPAESDPAHTFGLIWGFVTSFDRAFVKVRCMPAPCNSSTWSEAISTTRAISTTISRGTWMAETPTILL